MHDKVLVAQGGGPTVVINQSLVGVVLEARKFQHVQRIYGARHGVRGIVDEDLVDLTRETSHNLEMVANTPSSALGSTRDKPDRAYCQDIFKVLQAHGIGYFLYIGGNDSVDTVRIVAEEAQGRRLRPALHPHPQDHRQRPRRSPTTAPATPRPPASSPRRSWAPTSTTASLPGVYVAVVMGRHAGWLTAAAALGQKYADDGPHLIYLPERDFVARPLPRRREGRHGAPRPLHRRGLRRHPRRRRHADRDPARQRGRARRPRQRRSSPAPPRWPTCCPRRSRTGSASSACAATPSATCSAASSAASPTSTATRRARSARRRCSTRCGAATNGSVTIHRTGFYSCEYRLTPLAEVAGKTRDDAGRVHRRRGDGRHRRVPHVPAAAARLGDAGGATGCG